MLFSNFTISRRPLLGGIALLLFIAACVVFAPKEEKATTAQTDKPALTAEQQREQDAEQQQFIPQHFGGEVTSGTQYDLVQRVGTALATHGDAKNSRKPIRFHLLAESIYINIYAIPTGDVYVTTALVNRMHTEGELAAALAGAVAHVLSGHHMEITPALQLQYTALQEKNTDARAVKLMGDAGYDPQAMLGMFRNLVEAYNAHADVTFFTTHPSSEDRITKITESIKALYPSGVPASLSK